jgi:hypothetical protein
MLLTIAKAWGRFVARDGNALLWSKLCFMNSIGFAMLHFLFFPHRLLIGGAVLMLLLSFLYFERAGLIALLDDKGERKAGERKEEDTHDFPG